MMKIFVSIIIPLKEINERIYDEILPALEKQTFKDFELVLVPDKIKKKEKFPSFVKIIPSSPKTGPADKRDLGSKIAEGKILAFIDDDVIPVENWLKNGLDYFKDSQVAAVCGPGITPTNDNLRQRVSGWVWQSFLGAGGAGSYRCSLTEKRVVDDYPSFNLMVRKKDFTAVGGFDSHFWPGEDTKLCHDLVYKLGKKIIYDPKILVYHHRRPVFLPHLKQISRFGIHRGHFARILPKTSRRLGYFLPAIFTLGLIGGPVLIFILEIFNLCFIAIPLLFFYFFSIFIYLLSLLATAADVYLKEKNLQTAFLLIAAIFLTHFVYGIMFIKGFLTKKLKR